ncbi:RcnB family protein [Sphingomonas aracearum]|uniref:Integral membrane protein n=1 Tax=Sphingomonas aracearum TaxID=2283317 RepID=A0A369VWH3_9SPHN|nr:RcnB family protein [Sphingomonas aracearum]RDE05422.1 hypothetical protein DVW87_09220 [Sphingomonas aracearum]
MKKVILGTVAAAILAAPLAAVPAQAQSYRHTEVVRQGPHRTVIVQRDRRPAYLNDWRRGQRFDYRQARNYRVINDYRRYNLRTPPRGYHYVRSGNDAVLVALTSGIIGAVIGNAIR